jgi:hypothetical protein
MLNWITHVTEIPDTIGETYQRAVELHYMTANTIQGITEQLPLAVYPVSLVSLITLSYATHQSIPDKVLQHLYIVRYPYSAIKDINISITPVKALTTGFP